MQTQKLISLVPEKQTDCKFNYRHVIINNIRVGQKCVRGKIDVGWKMFAPRREFNKQTV